MPLQRRPHAALSHAALLILAVAVSACSNGSVKPTPVLPTAPPVGPTTAPISGPSSAPTTAPTTAPTSAPTAAPTSAPLACAGQTTTSTNASATQTLATAGGSLCIPTFGGFGGTLNYPTVSTPVSVTLTSSTTNDAGFPALGSATPIFYLQIALGGGTVFGSGAVAGGGLTAPSIVAGQTYTVFGQATIGGIPINFSPCQSVATAGAGGNGTIAGLGTVLKGANIPLAATGVLEIEAVAAGAGSC